MAPATPHILTVSTWAQIEIMIANYSRILRDNHTVEPYVVVLTKNVDPRTVQNRLTLKCKPTEGALQVTGQTGGRAACLKSTHG